jgi:hypothetical protein
MTGISITEQQMTDLVAAGTAVPMLSDGTPGPVQLEGQWWASQAGQADYRPVTDQRQLAVITTHATRVERLRTLRTEAVATSGGGERS